MERKIIIHSFIYSFYFFQSSLFVTRFGRGVHMKDLISLHVALSDSLEGGLINFRKMAQLSLIFQELQELQNATPPTGANVDLVNTLRVTPLSIMIESSKSA